MITSRCWSSQVGVERAEIDDEVIATTSLASSMLVAEQGG